MTRTIHGRAPLRALALVATVALLASCGSSSSSAKDSGSATKPKSRHK